MLDKLQIVEEPSENKWFIHYDGINTEYPTEIDEQTALEILDIKNNKLIK